MTGGRVLILGATGRNFAAGMSGGIAYVFSEVAEDFHRSEKREEVVVVSGDVGGLGPVGKCKAGVGSFV